MVEISNRLVFQVKKMQQLPSSDNNSSHNTLEQQKEFPNSWAFAGPRPAGGYIFKLSLCGTGVQDPGKLVKSGTSSSVPVITGEEAGFKRATGVVIIQTVG